MYNIVIIGAGQLGSRHLQALLKIKLPIKIFVIDKNKDSIRIAKQRAMEVEHNVNIIKVQYLLSIEKLNCNIIDICIVSTTANERLRLIENLLNVYTIKYFILEKILFQKIQDYEIALSLFDSKNVKAWVNCPRRLFPVYKKIKDLIQSNERITYYVTGGSWGLASNAIHFIDHLSYLNSNDEFEFSEINTLNIIESKRKENYELIGSVYGRQSNNSEIILISSFNNSDIIINIETDSYKWRINESKGVLIASSRINDWEEKEHFFEISLQSELTNTICENLLNTGNCGLTTFKESSKIHKTILLLFLKKLFSYDYEGNIFCPIT